LAEHLGAAVRAIKIDNEITAWILDALKSANATRHIDAKHRLKKLQQQEEEIADRQDKMFEMRLDGKLPDGVWDRKTVEYEKALADIHAQRREVEEATAVSYDTAEQILKLCQNAYNQYVKQEPHDQAKLLKIVASNFVWDGEVIETKYHKPFDMLAETQKEELAPRDRFELPTRWLTV
jgi:seryl-tRNA(Sec) selenium transferase